LCKLSVKLREDSGQSGMMWSGRALTTWGLRRLTA